MSGHPHAAMLQFVAMAGSFALQKSDRKRAEMESQTQQLLQMAAVERDKSQAALLEKLASASIALTNRKMDLLFETFRDTQELIRNHHASLLREQEDLNRKRVEVDEEREVRMMRRIGEIDVRLLQLATVLAEIGFRTNQMAKQIGDPFRLPTTLQLA